MMSDDLAGMAQAIAEGLTLAEFDAGSYKTQDADVPGAPRWTVVLTRGAKSSMPVIPVHWAVARQLRYGDSLVILYREVSWA